MSIAVPLDELADRLAAYPWGYLVTVRDDGRAQSLAVPTRCVDGALVATIGRGLICLVACILIPRLPGNPRKISSC